jgi:SOS-response transcriptional repressor LexA
MDVYETRLANLVVLQGRMSRRDLAAKIGVAEAQLGHFFMNPDKNGHRTIGSTVARRIEEAFEKPRGWLDQQHEGRERVARVTMQQVLAKASQENTSEAPQTRASLPLISWVSAGLKEEAFDPYAPGAAEAWIDFEGPASSTAFCLRVRGESMVRPDGREPSFPDGTIIAVDPRRKPKSGEYAVFRFNNTDEATFKQFIADGPKRVLLPLNPSYPVIELTADAQLVGTVFETYTRRRF